MATTIQSTAPNFSWKGFSNLFVINKFFIDCLTAASSAGTTFTDLRNATSITENSRIYILKETPKGDFEITFGNGTVLGISPVAGNKVTVDYLSCKGASANGGKSFTPVSQINVNGVNYTVSSTICIWLSTVSRRVYLWIF